MASTRSVRTMFEICYMDSMKGTIEDLIRELNPYEWSYILHDRDLHQSGEVKKAHYHIYAKWLNPVPEDWVNSKLGRINHNIITASNKRACHQYMLHITKQCLKEGKTKYRRAEMVSNIRNVDDLLVNDSELKAKSYKIVKDLILDQNEGKITFTEMIDSLAEKDLLEFFNKYYNSIFRRFLMFRVNEGFGD